MPTYRRLQQYALAISVVSIIYCAAEGAVSIGLGAESASRSLVFFGIQSGIEVMSATMVLWRFWHVAEPGEERQAVLSSKELRFEKISSTVIASLLLALSLATEGTAIFGLVKHVEPSTSNASLIVSASALVFMVLLWLPKGYLARKLNSSAMQGETQCSLSCIQMTVVLFAGALIYRLWKGGWWVDSATSIILGLLFGWEGWKMWRWARSPDFDGGCCCSHKHDVEAAGDQAKAKVELSERKKDLCECCSLSEICRISDECKCPSGAASTVTCCNPVDEDGNKCCSHEYIPSPPSAQICCISETCGANKENENAKGSTGPTDLCQSSETL
ncbi:hypothetical protein E1B28_000239 [Marasmius oreades]|uniref:Transmembrane protein 163 n=1 Tax=Marasmius oreades TaxID=181124 RepID=A0A9P8AE56_9AGAR|nr:uncharacterized protein E1B28_000239 [Marasmius oreades]KAG7098277.1 hypothetical protein E1B28_000239 [Marasmius oreades]